MSKTIMNTNDMHKRHERKQLIDYIFDCGQELKKIAPAMKQEEINMFAVKEMLDDLEARISVLEEKIERRKK